MTPEERERCIRVTTAVSAITETLADMMKDTIEIRTVLRAALFMTDQYIADPTSKGADYRPAMKALVMKELGIGLVN